MLMVFKEGVAMPGLLLGGNGQALCACSCKRTEVRRYGAPVPQCLWFSKKGLLYLGYDWEEMVRRFAPVLVSGLKSAAMVHPCPNAYGFQRRGCYAWVMIGRNRSGALRLFL